MNSHSMPGRAYLVGSLAVLLAAGGAAWAQNIPIEEIVVTAQKRDENLQEVPAAVSVMDAEQLSRLQATQLVDYIGYTPGINVSSGGSPGQTTVTLRGIAPVGPGSVVGTYIDDTPLGSSSNYARATIFALDLMPYDVERVEVLRGPQGTLYGAGAMGGLLKYVLREPDLESTELTVGLEGRDIRSAGDPGYGLRAAFNAPLSSSLAFRASAFHQETPGYIDNLVTGERDQNDLSQYGGRATLLWRPDARTSVKLGGVWQRTDSDNDAAMALELTGTNPPMASTGFGDLNALNALPNQFEKKVDYWSLTIERDLGWADFVSATSYSDTRTLQQDDASETFGSLYPLLTGGLIPAGLNEFLLSLDLEKWTQEFRLVSPGDRRLEWMVGAFYTEEDSRNMQESFAMDMAGQEIEIFSPYFAFASLPSDYREVALFGNLTWKFTDVFDVTVGLRWADNDQDFRQISGGAIIPVADDPGSSSEDVVTYMISPRLRLTDDTMIYGRVASGYRPGGPNVVLPGVPPQVDADKLTNYELGLKTEFLDRRAVVNIAVFHIDWKDIQQAQFFGGVSALANAGDAESKGVELESVFRLGESLRLGVMASYTDASLESSPAELDNVLGAQLPGVPEWTAALTAEYAFRLAGHDAHIGGGWRYVGEQESTVVRATNNTSYLRPSYDVIDLNAAVLLDKLTLRLFARNLTDERGYTGGGPLLDGFDVPVRVEPNVLTPRTVGFSMDYRF